MDSNDKLIIPSAKQLRDDIRTRAEELRALRKLLRLAHAAEAAGISAAMSLTPTGKNAKGAGHGD
jgi:hypothetical protein